MSEIYREPTEEEKSLGEGLVGCKIEIFWDGDNIYYPAKVIGYLQKTDIHTVVYEKDDPSNHYSEDLKSSRWKIYCGDDEDDEISVQLRRNNPGRACKVESENDGKVNMSVPNSASGPKPSYSHMVIEAVVNLNEKGGSSLPAIRKYIQTHFNITQQTASFNNLTLKAVNKAVALNELERVKQSFKLSVQEKERRKEIEKVFGSALNDPNLKKGAAFYFRNKAAAEALLESAQQQQAPDGDEDNYFLFQTLFGSAAAHNKALRKELIHTRSKRDHFLENKLALLQPFLPEKNYFVRKQAKMMKFGSPMKAMSMPPSLYPSYLQQQQLGIAGPTLSFPALPQGQSPFAYPHAALLPQLQSGGGSTFLHGGSGVGSYSAQPSIFAAQQGSVSRPPLPPGNALSQSMSAASTSTAITKIDTVPAAAGGEEAVDDTQLLQAAMRGIYILTPPSILKAKLHEHQIQGISWMVHMFQNGMPMILADQMGLGKTIQSIGFMAYLHEKLNRKGPHLVVVPLSVLSNWITEFERFCPSFRVVRFHGPKDERNRLKEEEMSDLAEFDVVVTTYEVFVSEATYFRRKYVWTSVIVDEGHRLKNNKSLLSDKIRFIPTFSKILLTGTPLQNNLKELWSLLNFLLPDIFTSHAPFDEGFDLARKKIDSNVLRKARKMLSVFMLRRLKEHIDITLPSKKEVTLLVPLTDIQAELYRQILCSVDSSVIETVMKESAGGGAASETESNACTTIKKVSSTTLDPKKRISRESLNLMSDEEKQSNNLVSVPQSKDNDWRKLMNMLLQLRKVCNHVFLFPETCPDPYVIDERIVNGSGKLQVLDRMLPMLQADKHRVLIFSQFAATLDLLEEYCALRCYQLARLDGETNRVKRRLDVRRYNAINSPLFIFLISTRAGGLGLNLASADTVILYDSDWNPQVDLQAMERVHRIGQTKPVRIYRLICRGSIEERIVNRAEKKLFLNAMVAEIDPDEQMQELQDIAAAGEHSASEYEQALGIAGTQMSKSELASLIRFGANAVLEGGTDKQELTDGELADLLERQGRDLPSAKGSASSSDVADPFQKLQETLKNRMEKLQEVDLRQLGNVVYTKKKVKPSNEVDIADVELDGLKRVRKERIVMVDGKGTGYGGAVPILSENLLTGGGSGTAIASRSRGERPWSHCAHCALCGRVHYHNPNKKPKPKKRRRNAEPEPEVPTFVKCAHCPLVFHPDCLVSSGIIASKEGAGMFICTHHRCADCNRNTSSAGGMLFRCVACMTAYCEDCLPQDEVDSLGRCRALEEYGYESRQSYYIRCPHCCELDNVQPLGASYENITTMAVEEPTAPAAESAQKEDGTALQPSKSVMVLGRIDEVVDVADAAEEAEIEANFEEAAAQEGEDVQEGAANEMDVSKESAEEEEEEDSVFPTQLLRIQWDVVPDVVDEAASPTSPSKRRRSSVGDGEEVDEAEALEEEAIDFENATEDGEAYAKPLRGRSFSKSHWQEVLDIVLKHPLVLLLTDRAKRVDAKDAQEGRKIRFSLDETCANIVSKIENGKYRSTATFTGDLKHMIESCLVAKLKKTFLRGKKKLLTEAAKVLVDFIDDDLDGVNDSRE